MTSPVPPKVAAGWYPDPSGNGGQRWWDGNDWGTPTVPPPAPSGVASTLATPTWQQPVAPDDAEAVLARKTASRALFVSIVAVVVNPALLGTVAATIWTVLAYRRSRRRPGVVDPRKLGWALGLTIASFVIGSIVFAAVLVDQYHQSLPTYDQAAVQQGIKTDLNAQLKGTGAQVTSVDCPTSPRFRAGATFECVAKASDGSHVLIQVDVQDDDGSYVWKTTG